MSSMKQRQQNTFVIKIQHESGGLMEEREKFPAAHLELRAQGWNSESLKAASQ